MKKNSHKIYLSFLLLLFSFLLFPLNSFAQSQNAAEVIQRYENGQITKPTQEEKAILRSYLDERMQQSSPVENTQYSDLMLATFINENFATATVTTPPAGWTQNRIAGDPTFDFWHFDNPGARTLNAPITTPAAIFDSDNYSLNGGAENVALESPIFSVPAAATVFLEWDQYFQGGFGGEANVEVFNGTSWVNVYTTTASTPNPDFQSINISTHVAGITNAQVRFRWVGDYSWYWIVDNVKVYSVQSGLTGVKNIPGDYATISAAVIDLNTQGVGNGGVTFNVAAGYTELLTAPIELTASGGPLDQIIFQKSGAGANPLITAFVGTQTPGSATHDDMWRLVGTDWVTIDGIDLIDPNAANPATMEGGYVLYKASDINGAQNNTIKNCVITLNRVNNATGSGPSVEGSRGIEVTNALPTTATTAVTTTLPAGTNSYNKFYINTIQNCNYGIVLSGFAATTPFDLGDTNNDIGGSSLTTGNTLINFGGGAAATNPSAGIRANNQWGVNISYNTINNNNGSGVNHIAVLRGIYGQAGTSANATITYNNITIHGGGTTSQVTGIENVIGSTAAGNTVNINNNAITGDYLTATTGVFYGIFNSASAATVNINNNTVSNLSYSTLALTGTGVNYPIYNSGAATNVNITFNTVSNITRFGTTGGTTIGIYVSSGSNQTVTDNMVSNMSIDGTGATSTMYGIQTSTGTIVVNNNIVSNLSCLKTTGTSVLYGMYNIASPTNENFNSNEIYNLTHAGTGTVYGLYAFTTTGVRTVSYNEIYNITGAGTTIAGINMASSSPSVFNNKIWNIQSTSTGAPTISGILQGSLGTSGVASIYNNLIGDLKAPNATTSSATAPTIRGINITTTTATTTINASYNTIYLNASTIGTAFGTAGLFATSSATATTATLNLRNNIIVNNSTPLGIGLTVAYQRSSTALNNYGSLSNNNDFYAGTPGASNLIFYDGTNAIQTIGDYKTLVSPLDGSSFTENPNFLSTVGTSANFLHINPATATQIESGGIPIAGITTDFDGDTRNATTPDVGADEFSGIGIDLTPPTIAYTPLPPTSSLSSRTLTSSITDVSGVPTAGIGLPVLYWRINSGAWNSSQATYLSGSDYQFTLGSGVVLGDTVKYYIVAQDNVAPPNVGAFPSGGAGGFTYNPPAAATPPTTPSSYRIVDLPLSGSYTVGTTLFNSITGRDITFEKSISKVMKEVVVETDAVKGVEYTETSPTVNGVKQLVEVEEISWIPMENGQKYEGDLFVKKADNPSLDIPEGIDGVYLTLTAAIADLNLRGVGGATTFLLTDATYPTETFPMIINVINENKPTAVNTVTIKPNTAVTAAVSGPSAASQLLRILNSHVIIDGSNSGGTTRDLTFENTSATTPQVILIGSLGTTPITNVTVKNCNIINGVNTSTPLIVSDGTVAGTAGWFNNITIQNNSIQKAYIGSYSIAFVSAGNGSGLSLLSNDLTTSGANSVRYTGLYLQGIDGANVSGNQIANFDGTSSEDDRGIWLATGTTNTVIQRNRIYSLKYTGTGGYGAYGAAISTGTLNANNSIVNNVIYDLSGDGWNYTSIIGDNPHGLYIFSTQSGINVYYNSINLFGNTLNQTSAMSTGICLGTGSIADIRDNNIVNNLGLLAAIGYGSAGIFVQTAASQLLPSNYNNMFVNPTGAGVKYVGQIATTGYATLAAWQVATTQDANSISADPMFVSNTDLRPMEGSPVLNAGTPIGGVTIDFLGVTRSVTTPTIGAYERPLYVPLSGTYTVGLSAFMQATGKKITFETRTRTVVKDLLGADAEVDVLAYDEKSATQPVINESQRFVTVTEEYLEMMEDGRPFDPGFFSSEESRGVYPTITSAVADLLLRGVSGPVTFLLVDTNYPSETYPIDLVAYSGASATNTVTFKPATGVQAVIPGSTTQTTATVRLNTDGQYYVIDGSNTVSGTTRDLSIIAPAVVPAVHFFSNGSNNVVKNSIIQSQQTSTGSGSLILAAGTACNNNLIDNCLFKPVPSAAIYAIGIYMFSATLSSNNTISNNEFVDFSARGITMQGAAGVNGNKSIKNLIYQTVPSTATTIYGIYLGRGKNNVVEGNVINNLQSTGATPTLNGIYYIGASGDTMIIKIFNNVVSLSASVNQTAGTIRGIDYFGYAANSVEIYYNTVYIGGSNVTAGTTTALAKRDDALNFIVKDNTFNNARSNISGTGIHYAVQYTDVATAVNDMNYNHYYASGNGGVFGIYGTTAAPDLTTWQTLTSQDANSISNDPIFVSNLDYRPQSVSPLLSAGLTISGITTDILGALRGTPPTIGAYENGVFVAINSPSNLTADPDTFTVDLSWQDNSNNEFAFVIQRKLGDSLSVNPWINIDTVNANVINYLDTGLSPNTMYTYRVFGYNSSGNSGFSNMVETTTFIPVELTAFTAELSGRDILVSWTTATELNNRGFDIERKMNDQWEKIGFKDGRGTTTTESSYSFIDKFTYESFVGTITYRLKQMDFDGTYAYSPEVEVNVDLTPKEYTLYQNYPNPFNPVTTIKYSLPFESNVRIVVYNILGEMLDVLVDETKQVGFHDFNWNGSNLASGIYIYTIEAKSVAGDKNYSSVKKMILMK